MTPTPGLICLGNLSLDEIVRPDGSRHLEQAGGDALYGCLAARLFDATAEFVAPVGSDEPLAIHALLGSSRLSTEGMPRRPVATLRNLFVYGSDDARNAKLLSTQEDFELLSPSLADIPPRYILARAFMVLAMTLRAQTELIRSFRTERPGTLLALDPQDEYIAGNVDDILALVAKVDVFLPSLDEVRALLGDTDALRAARFFASLGPRIVVIKMGGSGSLSYDARTGQVFRMPPCPGRVVDTTGAGDAFCAGFLATLASGSNLREASIAGAVAASFAVESFGLSALAAATPGAARSRGQAWRQILRGVPDDFGAWVGE